jgi:Spy/CpxP family protein refolding chaperone
MNHFRLLAISTLLILSMAASARQAAPGSAGSNSDAHSGHSGIPTVGQHLKVLSEKLDLSGEQQVKVKAILQELHDATQRSVEKGNLSQEERKASVRTARAKADKQIREVLNDDQKKELDQLESEPHPELHGNIKGSNSEQHQSPQN